MVMTRYNSIAEATQDIRAKVINSEIISHPLSSPTLAVVVPEWTNALSGFEAEKSVSQLEESSLEQVRLLFEQCSEWLTETAQELEIGTLNEHAPDEVLFMGLFRGLQKRFAEKQNLNPHKLAVLFGGRYTVEE
jgi:hypothetical protein